MAAHRADSADDPVDDRANNDGEDANPAHQERHARVWRESHPGRGDETAEDTQDQAPIFR